MADHACPGPGCKATVAHNQLCCRGHWFALPRALRNAVYRAWADGEGAGSAAHNAAILAAVQWLEGGRRG